MARALSNLDDALEAELSDIARGERRTLDSILAVQTKRESFDLRIARPEIVEKDGSTVVSARVEVPSCRVALPDRLWFSVPKRFGEHVTDDANGFAVALLPLAMTLGEDLHVDGALSPRLLRGMEEYQRVQCAWRPSPFRTVSIVPETLEAATAAPEGRGVGCSFSAGVDSAYSLWRHLPEREENPSYRISHCLMINGFDSDLDLENSGSFARIERAIQPMMSRLGVQFVVCRTNYMEFSDQRILKQTFAAMVTSPALVLGGLLSAYFIPSSYRFHDFYRDGSHLMLDHLIGTETMQTIHDSSHLTRTEKTRVVSQWSETYSTLRVCFNATGYEDQSNSIQNCCRCEKCIRTMKTLELYGGLERYTTFARSPTHLDVWMCHYGYKGSRIFAWEIIVDAYRAREFGIMIDFCVAVAVTAVFLVPRSILRWIHLFVEDRSDSYARMVRRMWPHLGKRPRLIK